MSRARGPTWAQFAAWCSRHGFDAADARRNIEQHGETIATVRLGAPTDADVEALRRAMVEAWQTWRVLADYSNMDAYNDARQDTDAAVLAYLNAKGERDAKRARGGL